MIVADQRVEKWTRWIDGTIKRNVLTMHLHREAWREIARIIRENGQLPDSFWWEFMRDTYAITQAVAVRRQADMHRDVESLGKLIAEIRDDAQTITRERWINLRDADEAHVAERAWATHYAGAVETHLDPAIPGSDFDALASAAQKVKDYVDQHVAHTDSSAVPAEVTLTLKDVHDTIDVIGHLFKKYYNLLTADSFVRLVPLIEGDWLAVFREPWIQPDQP